MEVRSDKSGVVVEFTYMVCDLYNDSCHYCAAAWLLNYHCQLELSIGAG